MTTETPGAAPSPDTGSGPDAHPIARSIKGAAPRVLRLSWVPLTAALLSLVLSLTSIYVSTRQPEVLLILPDVVRLAGGRASGGSYAYLQPAFVSTGNNDRVEVVRDMTLMAQRDGAEPVELRWVEQVKFVNAASGGGLDYQHEADAAPLLISPKTAAAPIGLFKAPGGWFFEPGTYRFTLEADRVVANEQMRASFSVTIRPEDAAILAETAPERFITYPLQ